MCNLLCRNEGLSTIATYRLIQAGLLRESLVKMWVSFSPGQGVNYHFRTPGSPLAPLGVPSSQVLVPLLRTVPKDTPPFKVSRWLCLRRYHFQGDPESKEYSPAGKISEDGMRVFLPCVSKTRGRHVSSSQ